MGVDLFFFRGLSFMRRELGCELDDLFFEFCNIIFDVVGDELNFLFICERLSKIFFFVGFIG